MPKPDYYRKTVDDLQEMDVDEIEDFIRRVKHRVKERIIPLKKVNSLSADKDKQKFKSILADAVTILQGKENG